jgi:hypothetical protein
VLSPFVLRGLLVLIFALRAVHQVVMCTYGPLFPSAQYTLATQFLIPTGFYVATALASIILIFPQTVNHMVT